MSIKHLPSIDGKYKYRMRRPSINRRVNKGKIEMNTIQIRTYIGCAHESECCRASSKLFTLVSHYEKN